MELIFNLNGKEVRLAQVPGEESLLNLLRQRLGLKGTKEGCGHGECGTCTVIMGGKTVNSCLVLAAEADGRELFTVEGLGDGDHLHPLQKAFIEKHGMQCGFCTSGMLMSSKALLEKNPDPTREEIKESLAGNLCRCTGYAMVIESVEAAAKAIRQGGNNE